MSSKDSSLVAALSSIVGFDLKQTITSVKNTVLNEQSSFGLDLFKQHSQSLRALQELILVVPFSPENEEKAKGERVAVEGFIVDVCLPFLYSFSPSYDGRTELSAAVLKICDMILACLKRSSWDMVVKIMETCLQSLTLFQRECTRHSESSSDQTLDIICALELLCTALEIPRLPETNQNNELYDQIFSTSLSIVSHLNEKAANRLISFVIIKLALQQGHKKDEYLQEVWRVVEFDVEKQGRKLNGNCLQQHLTMMTSMVNLFFPLIDTEMPLDVRKCQAFWELLQLGLYSLNPAVRKRAMYLLKRIIDTCEKSPKDFYPQTEWDKDCVPYFWWSKQKQNELSKMWEDLLLLLETLDEKQTHVIKPILPRMQTVLNASKQKNGSYILHTSWVVTLLMRAFNHESAFIIRWATETVLFMDFTAVPLLEQNQLQFLMQQLLSFLKDLTLYQRPDASPVGSCTLVGTGLKSFFASVCQSMDSKEHKVEFLQHVLEILLKENWSSVPLVFIAQGLACIPPQPVLNLQLLVSVREMVSANLTTLESFTRGAIECFLTKTVLNLIDKSAVGVDALADTLAVMERDESLQRGTQLWSSIVQWLLTSDDLDPVWGWPALVKAVQTMTENYLAVTFNTKGNVLAETVKVTKIARLLVLLSDCQGKRDQKGSQGQDCKPQLLNTLGSCVDIINSINTRAYMPRLKGDRAISLLQICSKELDKGKDQCSTQLSQIILSCWEQLLLYVERRALDDPEEIDNEGDGVSLDLMMFYADAVKTIGLQLPPAVEVKALDDLTNSCFKVLQASPAKSPLQRVAAVSLMSSLAQVAESMKLRKTASGNSEGVSVVLRKLCNMLATMSLGCDIFSASTAVGDSSFDNGRHVCQYMMSMWECLRVLLTHDPALRQAAFVMEAALDAFSVSSGECDLPIMQCLEIVVPQLVKDSTQHGTIMQALNISWSKVLEEIKSWSYWLKMEAFVNLVLQTPLLELDPSSQLGTYLVEVLGRFFEVGEEKAGMLNLVLARLCVLWSKPDGGAALAAKMAPTIVDACMFGTVHKKTERLWLDVCMYIETLKEECSANDILSSSSKNDIYVRLIAINYLSSLKPDVEEHRKVVSAVLKEVWQRYLTLAHLSTYRQYTNTLPHRQKHRLVAVFPLLDLFIDESTCEEYYRKSWEALVVECHPSVRQNLEWLVMRLAHRFPHQLLPRLYKYFDEFTDKRNVSLMSLLLVITRLGPELPAELQESYYLQVIPLVVPWTMAHHFNTRLHGQQAMWELWNQCEKLKLEAQKFSMMDCCMKFLLDNGNASAVLEKLKDNYFFSHFNFLHDYSMETLFYTLPRLACLNDEEWMHPDMFARLDPSWKHGKRLLPLYNKTQTLAACPPGAWKMKATVESSEESNESAEGNVQKKIIPWRLMAPDSHSEQEYSYRKKGGKPDGLILVTSLINKIPNLGGLCRTSEIFGVSEFVIGNLVYLNDRTFQSLSVTAEKWIPITEVKDFRLTEFLEEKKRESYTLVGVEQTANSVDLTEYKFPRKTLLVLGNEKEGIPPDILQQLDVCVEIPQQGIIRSLNVHVSGALLVWEYTRQQMEHKLTEQK